MTSFDLYNHYTIDTNKEGARDKLYRIIKFAFTVTKNDRNSIEIEGTDEDPQFAKDVVQAMVQKIDEMNLSLIMDKQKEIAELVKS